MLLMIGVDHARENILFLVQIYCLHSWMDLLIAWSRHDKGGREREENEKDKRPDGIYS